MSAMRRLTQPLKQSYTIAEFELMPQLEERYELINGRLVEKPMASLEHNGIPRKILKLYDRFDPDEKIGLLTYEINVRIRDGYAPAPDMVFWLASRRPSSKSSVAPRPDLAVEIHNTGTLQETTDKALEYIKAGVQLVWVIQVSRQIAAVFRPGQAQPEVIPPDGVLDAAPVIPGFQIKLSKLFEE